MLDEPTNHLDIPSRESLENALEEYDGTIVAVSHDRFFLDKIANQMLSFESDGSVISFDGNYTDFTTGRSATVPRWPTSREKCGREERRRRGVRAGKA